MNEEKSKLFRNWLALVATAFIVLGIVLRFFHINRSDFIFYDEGYYLNYNLSRFLDFVTVYLPYHPQDFWNAVYTCLKLSWAMGKALWFFIVDSRVFLRLLDVWYVSRVLSAVAGVLTLGMVFSFARKFFSFSTRGLF